MTARLAEMEEKTALLEKEVKTLKQAIQELEHTLSGLREDGEAFRTKQQDVKAGCMNSKSLKRTSIPIWSFTIRRKHH